MKLLFILILITLSIDGHAMQDSLPTLKNYSQDVQDSTTKRIKSLGENYKPRTEHLNKDGSAIFVNDLIFEESPYLLQHAHNPVNWHAWSPKAFELAKTQNKPIFLSIGYATCHWCHVMEHESFEDIEIAQFINEHFIAIKVDRERRTAIDAYYMTGVQMMTGHGGWPMSNFLTPQAKPFFGGTYYNPTQFMTLLKRVSEVWKTQQPELQKQALQMDAAIQKYLSKSELAKDVNQEVFDKANDQLLLMHDEMQGGFSAAPKFPQEPWLLYLLSQNKPALKTPLLFTLNEMQQGGIYDQIGGGFHRYAVDNEWLAPHFEKMLYNQSQLSEVYTQATMEFNNPEYKRTVIAILDYVILEMTSEHGVFYSAGDADSEGEEGLFFTWTVDELKTILSKSEYEWLKPIYQFSKKGNFEHRNIFNLKEPLTQTAKQLKLPYSELVEKLNTLNQKLYLHRKKRIHPLIDDKIITSWNAQMIYSLANAAYLLDKPPYLKAATQAMDYILKVHTNKQGYLVRNSLNNKASTINAELEDYAWSITALVKLYDVTSNQNWLKKAGELIQQTEKLFVDKENGGFFDNIPEDNIPNISRIKKSEDGAIVSANGQLLIALARYYRRTGDLHIDELFTQSLAAFSGKVANNPISHTSILRAKDIYDNGENSNIVYTGNGNVKISSKRNKDKLIIAISIKEGWHINSHLSSIESLIPLSIKTKQAIKFKYPEPKTTQLDFSDKDLSTFEGDLVIVTGNSDQIDFPLQLTISIQTCSNNICLAPKDIRIKLFK